MKRQFLQFAQFRNKPTTENSNEGKEVALLNEDAYGTLTGANAKSVDEMIDALENVSDEHFEDATSEYLELKEGEIFNGLFTGMTTFTNDKQQEIEAVLLTGKENRKYIYAGAVVVGSLKKVTQMPCLIRLTHKGKVKGKNGTYHDIQVQVLKPAVK
jgi:hypothetical protein